MSICETIDLSAERYNRHETHDDVDFILSVIGERPKRILGCSLLRAEITAGNTNTDTFASTFVLHFTLT